MSRHDVNYEVLGRRSSTASSGSAADLDDDGDVDVDDFVIFQPQLTGPLAEVAAAAMAMEQMAAPMALMAAPQAEAVVVEPWTDEESSATLRVKGLSGGPALTVLQPHTTYQLHYRAGVEEVNGFMVSVYADGDAQEISGVSASTGEWSDADVFEFIDMATAGGDPTYDGNGRMLRQIVHGFWFTGSGESVEELADRRGQLFQFTTGDAGTIHFELFMDWIDVASREGVWMRTDLTVEVVDPTASASSASDAMVADSSFKPYMGFDAQFGSALVAALLATGGTEPEFALADLDGDGDADLADFAMFQAAFGTTGGTRYTWNTENRLTGVEPLAPNTDDKKLQFVYDHMGRRVLKRVWTYTAGSWGNPTAETKYVYDGWRVIMELDGLNSDAVTRKFTWGLDLSGSVEGAGGIGGLLATEDTAGTTVTTDDRTFIYLYELNGNVGQLVETTTGTDYGTIAAKYEYDPYGKRINTATQGEYDQPYRFSTKPVDDETGLGNWGYRYYSYDLGRWVSRDPIGERGGVNLYGYVKNNILIKFDILGQHDASPGSTPRPPIDNFDEQTHLGGILTEQLGNTVCGIFVVRLTYANGLGHTMLVWKDGVMGGYPDDPIVKDDSKEIDVINKRKFKVSVYAVRYNPGSVRVDASTERANMTHYAYQSGKNKGECCPMNPDCSALRDCLAAQIGKPHGMTGGNPSGTIDEKPNCNSFARVGLEKCCLKRGALVVNNFDWSMSVVNTRWGNMVGWNLGGGGPESCGKVSSW